MTLQEIKEAIAQGKRVHWANDSYQVVKDKCGAYLIKHSQGHCIGLTWADCTTLNGRPDQFYIKT